MVPSKSIDYKKIDFFDCVADYFKSVTLDTDNLLTCQMCNQLNKSQIQYRIKTCKCYLKFKTAMKNNCQLWCSAQNFGDLNEEIRSEWQEANE